MERLDFSKDATYNNIEACIHLNRYSMAKPYCKNAKVLDAACGQGYGSYLMKCWGAKEVDGIDISEDAICQAKKIFKADGLNYTQNTIESLPYEDNTFDLVVSLETMEHIDDVDSFLKEIKRVLKPDGVIILSCPNDNYYYQNDDFENPYHKRAYTFFEFREIAEKHLGNCGDFYLAFALDGFINIPFEHRTEPDRSYIHDALSLFKYIECDEALCVPQERFLNHWNCNYFVGVWGNTTKGYRYNATISPRETFIDHKDIDYDLLAHLDETKKAKINLGNELADALDKNKELSELNANLENELADALGKNKESSDLNANLESELADALNKIQELTGLNSNLENELADALGKNKESSDLNANLESELANAINKIQELTEFNQEVEKAKSEILSKDIEQKRLYMLLDLTTKERDFARETILKKDDYIHELEPKIPELQQKNAYIYELEAKLAETQKNYEDTASRYEAIVARLNSLESSRGVKLLQKWYTLRHRKENKSKRK